MSLYTRFRVANFRGLSDLDLMDLRRLNLIVGRNNTGKTSVLEAIAMAIGHPSGASRLRSEYRVSEPFLLNVDANVNLYCFALHHADGTTFVRSEPSKQVDSTAERSWRDFVGTRTNADGSKESSEDLVVLSRSLYRFGAPAERRKLSALPCFPQDQKQELERFDQAILNADAESAIEATLARLDHRVKSVRALVVGNADRALYVDIGLPKRVPLAVLGQGMQRLLALTTHGYEAKGGVLLIDEIENGLHHSYLEQLWRGLLVVAERLDLQIFATTHSYECLVAAVKATADSDGLAVHRLERGDDGAVRAVSMSGDVLVNAVEQGVELR